MLLKQCTVHIWDYTANYNHNVQLGVGKECWVAKVFLRNANFSRNCTKSNENYWWLLILFFHARVWTRRWNETYTMCLLQNCHKRNLFIFFVQPLTKSNKTHLWLHSKTGFFSIDSISSCFSMQSFPIFSSNTALLKSKPPGTSNTRPSL